MAHAMASFTNSQNMKRTGSAAGDAPGRPVNPQANSAPGTTTAPAPYSAETTPLVLRVINPLNKATSTPTRACAISTRQGEIAGN